MSVEFLRPKDIAEACQALAAGGAEARVVAGGTALSLMIRHGLTRPERLVSLEDVAGLRHITQAEDGLRIGAMVCLRDIELHPGIRRAYPALALACGEVGNVRVRNQATLGGNLSEADYASDPPPALLVLNAFVRTTSPEGERTVPLGQFFRGVLTTDLRPSEILVEIVVPPPTGLRSTFLKFRSRSSEDRPCLAVAAAAVFDGNRCADLRLAVGAACETPLRLAAAEALAEGRRLTAELIDEIATAYAEGIEPIDDLRGSAWYRRELTRVFIERALREVSPDHR